MCIYIYICFIFLRAYGWVVLVCWDDGIIKDLYIKYKYDGFIGTYIFWEKRWGGYFFFW